MTRVEERRHMKTTTSQKQLEANRRNARKSTGPRTAEGRAVSRMNAVRHGILSTQVVVRGTLVRESVREFKALHEQFRKALQPEGAVEEMLVDEIVTAHWRKRRALQAEAGEILLHVEGESRKRQRGRSPKLQCMLWGAGGSAEWTMQQTSSGAGVLASMARQARARVEQDGCVTEEAVAMGKVFGEDTGVSLALARWMQTCRELPEGPEGEAARTAQQAEVLKELKGIEQGYEMHKRIEADYEWNREQAHQAADVLPKAETLEKIMRYETKLERQIYRAMAQLERLQRMRHGENIPAPLTVDVLDKE